MARKPTLCLSRQQRLASQLHASQDKQTLANAMARKPNKCTVIPTRAPPHPSGVLRPMFSVILSKKCVVLSIPVCILPVTITKPETCAGFLPMPHRFRCSKLFPWSFSFPVSQLLPDPGSAGGAGGRKEKDGGRSTMRLTVCRRTLLMSATSSVSTPISKIAYAEGQQGDDQIGKIGVDPPRRLPSKGVSSNV